MYERSFTELCHPLRQKGFSLALSSKSPAQNKKGHFARNDPSAPKTGNKNGVP